MQDATISNPVAGEVLGITSVTDGVPAWGNVEDAGGSTVNVDGSPVTNPDFQDSTGDRAVQFTADSDGAITAIANSDDAKQDNLSTAQLNVVNANPFTTAEQSRLANVQPFALDNNTDIPETQVPDSIARDNELINNLEINNGILEAFTASSPSVPVASISLGAVSQPVEYVFDTIATRNSGLQSNGVQLTAFPDRVITVTVLSDSVTNPDVTDTTFWYLNIRPTSGVTTTAANWVQLGTRGVQVSSVIGCVYDPDDDAADVNGFVEVQLGTEDTTEGISADTARTLFFSQDNNLSELIVGGDEAATATNQAAAIANLGAATEVEAQNIVARLEYEIENVDPFTDLQHAADYNYRTDAVIGLPAANTLTGNIELNTNQDFQNVLGLFFQFNSAVTDVPEPGIYYIFDDGDAADGDVPDLVLRRNDEDPTNLATGTVLGFSVVEGQEWLDQFLEPPSFPGSHTRPLNINTADGLAAFQNWYVRLLC